MKQIRMLPGAPPDSELQIRFLVSKTYTPSPANYKQTKGTNDPDYEVLDGTLLGYLKFDKNSLEKGYYDPIELLDIDMSDHGMKFELVDAEGRVWTEEYDDGEPDPDEITGKTD